MFDQRSAFAMHGSLCWGEGGLKYCPGLGNRESRVRLHLLLNLMWTAFITVWSSLSAWGGGCRDKSIPKPCRMSLLTEGDWWGGIQSPLVPATAATSTSVLASTPCAGSSFYSDLMLGEVKGPFPAPLKTMSQPMVETVAHLGQCR